MAAPNLIELSDEEHQEFRCCCRSGKITVRLKQRLSIVQLADEGLSYIEIAEHIALNAHSVGRWRNRFIAGCIAGIERDRPRGLTRNTSINANYVKLREQFIRVTTREKLEGDPHWITRALAKKVGTNR